MGVRRRDKKGRGGTQRVFKWKFKFQQRWRVGPCFFYTRTLYFPAERWISCSCITRENTPKQTSSFSCPVTLTLWLLLLKGPVFLILEQVGGPLLNCACLLLLCTLIHPWVYSDIQQKFIEDLFVPESVLEVNPDPQALIGWWAILLICACSYYIGEVPLQLSFSLLSGRPLPAAFPLIMYRVEFSILGI